MLRRYLLQYVLAICGIVIGLMISFQIFSPKPTVTNPWEPITELDKTVQVLNASHQQLQKKITELRNAINVMEKTSENSEVATKLDVLKKHVGLTDVTGSGVRLTLDIKVENYLTDNPNTNYCFAADLRDIINLARAGGADAITINGQRIIAKTPVACFGSSVLINNLRFLPPFTITIITKNPEKVLSYMTTQKYLGDLYQKIDDNWVTFTSEIKETMTAPVFAGSITPNFVQ